MRELKFGLGCRPHLGGGGRGDVPGLVARVLAGEEIVIDSKAGAVKVVPEMPIPRTTIEIIARLDARERERGYAVTMDEDFRKDMEEIIANRKPANRSAWD